MKKRLIIFLFTIALFTGCASGVRSISQINPQLGAIPSDTTYSILGKAEGTASAKYLIGFIPLQRSKNKGYITNDLNSFYVDKNSKTQQAAIYEAIRSMPEADGLITPTWKISTKNYILFQLETVTVKGVAIKYNVSK